MEAACGFGGGCRGGPALTHPLAPMQSVEAESSGTDDRSSADWAASTGADMSVTSAAPDRPRPSAWHGFE